MLAKQSCSFLDVPAGEYLPGIRMTVRFVDLLHHQHPVTGECNATIVTLPKLFMADGTPLDAALGRLPYVDLVANNNTIINTETGAFLGIRELLSEADWAALVATLEADPTPAAYQGDVFWQMRHSQSLVIDTLILYHMSNAVTMGRYARPAPVVPGP
jgi:hypothetical protein